jgi:hypothetical protein
MTRRLVPVVVLASVALSAAPAAQAKISLPLGGRTLKVGQQVELRVPGCSSAKVCRWAAGTRLVLAPPSDLRHRTSMRTIARLGVVSPYGMVRFQVPRVDAGSYSVVAIWPHLRWNRSVASAAFTITV